MKRDLGAAVPETEDVPVVGIATLVVTWLGLGIVALSMVAMLAMMLARAA